MNEGNNDLIRQKKKFMEQIIIVSKYITIKLKKTSNYRINNSKHR